MKLTATNNFPALKSQVDQVSEPDADPRDNDAPLRFHGSARNELAKLLKDGKVEAEESPHSCGAESYDLFDGMLRVRISHTGVEFAVKRDANGYWMDVTNSERGPWWKSLRGAILDALEADLDDQLADLGNLEGTWNSHFTPAKAKRGAKK